MAEPSLKILILFILIILIYWINFLDSNCTSCDGKIVLYAVRNLLSWKELSCALLSVAWLSRMSASPRVRQQHCHRDCPCVCDHCQGCLSLSLTGDTQCFWDSHGHLSVRFPAVIATCTLLLSLSFSVVRPWGFAFCSFVVGFYSSSGLQCVVRAWRCSAHPSGLSTVQVSYVVACDGCDKVLCLCFPMQYFCFNVGIVKFISALYLLTSIFIFAVCCVN